MIFNMHITGVNKQKIIELFHTFPKNSFEYDYIFNDCIPYFDKNYYWNNRREKPTVLFDDKNEVSSVCFWIIDSYKNIKFVDIKRIFTVETKRGKGYASVLLKNVCNVGGLSGAKYIRMFCNPDSTNFYSSLGYNFHGETDEGYKFVFQPLKPYQRDNETLVNEREYIEQQIKKYNGIVYT